MARDKPGLQAVRGSCPSDSPGSPMSHPGPVPWVARVSPGPGKPSKHGSSGGQARRKHRPYPSLHPAPFLQTSLSQLHLMTPNNIPVPPPSGSRRCPIPGNSKWHPRVQQHRSPGDSALPKTSEKGLYGCAGVFVGALESHLLWIIISIPILQTRKAGLMTPPGSRGHA